MVDKTSSTIGTETETIACEYLCARGLTVVCRNFLTPLGEIDIIMRDRNQLVFVEVRYRSSKTFGSAESSITRHKIRKMRAASDIYLQKHRLTDKICSRFDVIAMHPKPGHREHYDINWIVDIDVA